MFPNLVPDRVEMDITLDELIPLAARHGYGGIDLPLPEVAARPDHPQLADAMSDAGLRWGAFNLPVAFRSDRATYDAGVGRLEAWLPIVQALGCDRCYDSVVPGHDTLDYSANFEHHVARLKPIAEILADHGIRLGLEFIGPKTLRETFRYPFIHTIAQVLDLCEAISPTPGNGEVGILLDSYHWWTSRASERDIIELLGHDRIVYVDVNDGRAGRSRDEQMDLERTLPCETGLIDSRSFIHALKTVGYAGPLRAEPFDDRLKGKSADEIAGQVMASLQRMMALA